MKKRTKVQWILSIVLAAATLVLAISGATGYIMRSSDSISEKLIEMRTYAVLRTAANGIIDSIAKAAKDEAKEWATAKNAETGEANVKGRDNQRDYYNAAEAKARAEAIEQYAHFDGIDLSPLTAAIPKMEAAEKAYFDLEAQEKVVYDTVYLQAAALASTQVSEWMTDLESHVLTFDQLTSDRLDAAKESYAALTEEEKPEYAQQFAEIASAVSSAFGLTSAPDADGFDALLAAANEALPLYDAMDESAKVASAEALSEPLTNLTRLLAGLAGQHWTSTDENTAHAEAFSAEAMAFATEAYTAQYGALSADCEKGFDKVFKKVYKTALDDAQAADSGSQSVSDVVPAEEDTADATAVAVDYSGFFGSEALAALQSNIDVEYDALWAVVETVLPNLTDDMKADQRDGVVHVIYAAHESYETEFARYAAANGMNALSGMDAFKMTIASSAYNLVLGAVALLVITMVAFFYQTLIKKLGLPRLIIGVFFVMLLILSGLYGLNMSSMMSNVLKRTGQYGILVLAMLPGIQCGISLNMGMTVGIVAGLLSTLIALESNMTGWPAFLFAVVVGCVFAAPIGWAYSKLLNRLKGNEMTVSTYVGFSFVSLMSIFWMILPFRNPKLTWALGTGLRVMHTMAGNIGGLLNNFLAFNVLGVTVPTGLILFLLLCCGVLWLFSRSRTGTAMIAAGSNPRFAEASGISVDKMRTIGTTLSTMVAAVGIIVYSQSFGFMQLYSGPRQMGFTAASAILIGGASTSRAKVSHVLIGTFLFQGVLSMGILVANQAISASGLSEVMRILISNGIILYALTQSGGEN